MQEKYDATRIRFTGDIANQHRGNHGCSVNGKGTFTLTSATIARA
jgi:hypothetical protein